MENLNRLLSKPFCSTNHLTELMSIAESLVANVEAFLVISDADEMKPILRCIEENIPLQLEIVLSRVLKILMTKAANQVSLEASGMRSLIVVLERHAAIKSNNAVDICNVILNSCYNTSNAQNFVDEGGLTPLVSLLLHVKSSLGQASVLGALQGICYIPGGRYHVRAIPEVHA